MKNTQRQKVTHISDKHAIAKLLMCGGQFSLTDCQNLVGIGHWDRLCVLGYIRDLYRGTPNAYDIGFVTEKGKRFIKEK